MSRSQPVVARRAELDAGAVREAYAQLEAQRPDLATLADWEALFRGWNELKARISGARARLTFREAQDTTDEGAAADNQRFREEVLPLAEEGDARLRQLLLESPVRAQLEERFGALLFRMFAVDEEGFSPANIALNVEAGELASRYERILGGAELRVADETLTIPRAAARMAHPEEGVRKAAWQGLTGWLLEKSGDFHGIYDELIGLRGRMARHLGEENFIRLGYRRLHRLDYGPAEVEVFREAIRRHVVPLHARLRARQAEWLGEATVRPWNMDFFPGLSLPPGIVPVERQLAQAQTMFDRLHPVLGGHFRAMVDRRLIDLENRPGKRPGAFCTSFDDEQAVAIFCNSTGDQEDVSILAHEMGHAFQGWESQFIEPIELRWPTYEACEVHSMGMEYLSLRHLDAFFGPEEAAKYRKLKLIDPLLLLPRIAVVDAFQHWVYANPGHTHAQRDATWDRLWDEFMPGVDFTGHEAVKSTRWKRQPHIFVDPFYYIDYAIAESGALQLWLMAERDPEAAMTTYLQLCRLGGTLPLQAFFKEGGLVSPFDPDVFAPAMEAIARELGL